MYRLLAHSQIFIRRFSMRKPPPPGPVLRPYQEEIVHASTSCPIRSLRATQHVSAKHHLGQRVLIRGLTASCSARRFFLRRYQEEALHACTDALAAGKTRIAVSLPTGAGKTIVFLHLLARMKPPSSRPSATRALIIVPTIELVHQTVQQARKHFPELQVTVDQGSERASPDADLTVATFQTLAKPGRLAVYDANQFKAIIVDEAHRAASASYRTILSRFHSDVDTTGLEYLAARTRTLPPARVPIIGFSATFSRHDGLGLKAVFEDLVYSYDFLDMIKAGWLSKMRFTIVQGAVDLNAVQLEMQGNDYDAGDLDRILNNPEMNRRVVATWKEHAARRRSTLVFCATVDHLKGLTKEFNKEGIRAEYLTCRTSRQKRQALLEEFRGGQLPVLLNIQVLAEGADVPNIDCILLVRATQSHTLFKQMIGRGSRLSTETGKRDCHIIDFVNTACRAGGVITTPTLSGSPPLDEAWKDQPWATCGIKKPALPRPAIQDAPFEYTHYDSIFAFATAVSEVYSYSPLSWVDCGGGLYLLDCYSDMCVYVQTIWSDEQTSHQIWRTQVRLRCEKSSNQLWRMALPVKWWAKKESSTHIATLDTLKDAIRLSDNFVRSKCTSIEIDWLSRGALWRHRPASESHRAFTASVIKRAGLDEELPDTLTKGRAQEILIKAIYAPLLRRT